VWSKGPADRRTALVVESDRALRDLLRLHLSTAGFDVLLAPDAVVAGRTILNHRQVVDVLIVDSRLPFMSGIDFVSTLIADSSLRFIPTIVVARDEHEAGRADMLGVPSLVTPFSSQQLVDLVRSTIATTSGARHAHAPALGRSYDSHPD